MLDFFVSISDAHALPAVTNLPGWPKSSCGGWRGGEGEGQKVGHGDRIATKGAFELQVPLASTSKGEQRQAKRGSSKLEWRAMPTTTCHCTQFYLILKRI